MKKRRFIALIGALMLLSACDILGPVGSIGAPEATATPDLGQPDGVARAFLDAWTKKDYAGMYSLLSPNSQADHTLDEFTATYTGAEKAMTLKSLTATPRSVLPESTGTTAQFSFHVVYDTTVLGPIERDLTMQMVLIDNSWRIAWSPSLIFPELAGGNTLQLQVQSPSRANIYDRNGLSFVTANADTVTIVAVPGQISAANEGQMLSLLSRVLRLPQEVIKSNYAGFPADWKVALGDADKDTVQANAAQLQSYPALSFPEKTGRRYFNALAPHVMGYTSYISKDQLPDYQALGYQGDELVGQSGLEKWGEQYLAGTRGGTLSAYTSGGQFSAQIATRAPQPAQSLYTTLDRKLQGIVQDTLTEAYLAGTKTWSPNAGGAAVVVLDVNTGNVLAMASYPDFDPNTLNPLNNNPRTTATSYQDLVNSSFKPFLNRAAQGQYPPGSVFKIVTTASALESGVFTPSSTYTCTGVWDGLGEQARRYDWKKDGHGTITFAQALTASCDPWFYQAGLLTGQKDPNIIPTFARQFGFGQSLGIQIDENPGLIPDPNWLKQTRGQEWGLGDSVNIAIGQGDVLATPLQIATMIAAIANDGTVYRPHFVDHIGLIGEAPSITFQPEVIGKVNVSQAHLQTIRESMRAVITDSQLGTAVIPLGDMQIPVAGKTGTAQVSGVNTPPIAWFAGFAPYDKPEIAVVVMVENGGEGSVVAAPIWRRIVERYYNVSFKDWPPPWFDPTQFDFVKNTIGD
jgi:penicillin-binding protein 2